MQIQKEWADLCNPSMVVCQVINLSYHKKICYEWSPKKSMLVFGIFHNHSQAHRTNQKMEESAYFARILNNCGHALMHVLGHQLAS